MNGNIQENMVRQPQKESAVISVLKALAYGCIYLGVQFAVSFAYELILVVFYVLNNVEALNIDDMSAFLYAQVNSHAITLTIVCNVVAIAVVSLIIFLRRKNPRNAAENRRIFSKPALSNALLAFIIGASLNPTISVIMGFLSYMLPQSVLDSYMQHATSYADEGVFLYAILAVVTAPIIEELIFRGMMISRLNRALPKVVSICISALLFGIMHGNVFQAIYAATIGIVLGFMYSEGGSLWISMIAHFAFNLASLPSYIWGDNQFFTTVYSALMIIAVPVCVIMCFIFFYKMYAAGAERRKGIYSMR